MTQTITINWNPIIKYIESASGLIPDKAGIYEIFTLQTDGKYQRKYVGIADNLRKRYLEHLSVYEQNENIKNGAKQYVCGFGYTLADQEEIRKDAELGLYMKYQYPWNKVQPEGSGNYSNIVITETRAH